MNTNFVDSIVGAALHKKCLATYIYDLSPAKPYQFIYNIYVTTKMS